MLLLLLVVGCRGAAAGCEGRGLSVDLMLFLHQTVDVVLGAVLRRRHLEHECHAEQGFVGFLVGNDLQDGKVLQHAVHHVLLG